MGSCGKTTVVPYSYLSDFVPVSIKMAKEQNLSLNPQKISECLWPFDVLLKMKAQTYEYLNSTLPKEGDFC